MQISPAGLVERTKKGTVTVTTVVVAVVGAVAAVAAVVAVAPLLAETKMSKREMLTLLLNKASRP